MHAKHIKYGANVFPPFSLMSWIVKIERYFSCTIADCAIICGNYGINKDIHFFILFSITSIQDYWCDPEKTMRYFKLNKELNRKLIHLYDLTEISLDVGIF